MLTLKFYVLVSIDFFSSAKLCFFVYVKNVFFINSHFHTDNKRIIRGVRRSVPTQQWHKIKNGSLKKRENSKSFCSAKKRLRWKIKRRWKYKKQQKTVGAWSHKFITKGGVEGTNERTRLGVIKLLTLSNLAAVTTSTCGGSRWGRAEGQYLSKKITRGCGGCVLFMVPVWTPLWGDSMWRLFLTVSWIIGPFALWGWRPSSVLHRHH